jgi:hypothetical protein
LAETTFVHSAPKKRYRLQQDIDVVPRACGIEGHAKERQANHSSNRSPASMKRTPKVKRVAVSVSRSSSAEQNPHSPSSPSNPMSWRNPCRSATWPSDAPHGRRCKFSRTRPPSESFENHCRMREGASVPNRGQHHPFSTHGEFGSRHVGAKETDATPLRYPCAMASAGPSLRLNCSKVCSCTAHPKTSP